MLFLFFFIQKDGIPLIGCYLILSYFKLEVSILTWSDKPMFYPNLDLLIIGPKDVLGYFGPA